MISAFGPTTLAPLVCTSSSRPPAPTLGMQIQETNTNRTLTWSGTEWYSASPLVLLRQQAVLSGSTTGLSTVTYADWPTALANTNASGSFTKLAGATTIVLHLDLSGWMNVANQPADIALRINGADVFMARLFYNTSAQHQVIAGDATISGLAAGTYTFQGRARVGANTVTLNHDTNDYWALTVWEVV